MNFTDLPFTTAELEAYHLNAKRLKRPNLLGGHITRQRGQSLEFREFSRYALGDDIRHVDWRASLRTGGNALPQAGSGWLVRKFSAEEHFKLVISIDVRQTMLFPEAQSQARANQPAATNISKLQMARWLAAALTFVALRSNDQVVLHRLFGNNAAFFSLRGSQSNLGQISNGLDEITAEIDTQEIPNLTDLDRHLPPTSVWVIITDYYFRTEQVRPLLERIRSAQDGMRWVMLIDLDSWQYERHMLESGSLLYLIDGPGVKGQLKFDIAHVGEVSERIQYHKNQILKDCQGSADIVQWKWPTQEQLLHTNYPEQLSDAFKSFFKNSFLEDEVIRQLFKRGSWS